MSDLNILINSQYLFLRSAQTDSYDTIFEFDTDVLTAAPEHQMSITVVDFTMQIQYYVINSENNTLTFIKLSDNTTHTIIISPGNYNYSDLCLAVSKQYLGVKCIYDKNSNKAVFRFNENHGISFLDSAYKTFGFDESDHPSGTEITSTYQLDLKNGVNQICIHATEGISSTAFWNVDNFSNQETITTKPSDVLCVIPFDTAPFTVLHWQNPGNQYEMFINEKNVSRLHITLRDIYGSDLTYLNPYTITFLVKIYKKNVNDSQNRQLSVLSQILEYTKLSFVSGK
jgi:hypothetical protein